MSKRITDILGSLVVLAILSPVLATVAILVRWRLGKPVLFRQERLGIGGVPFHMTKFRTMTDLRGPNRQLLPDAERLTPLGRALRRWSLDELPELLDVIRGQMSLVGPRPLPIRYGPRYSPQQNRRHEVKPGLTGWAQVKGRNALSWEEKFELDVWYVDHRRSWLDLKILWLTATKVVRGEGVNSYGEETMPEFLGD